MALRIQPYFLVFVLFTISNLKYYVHGQSPQKPQVPCYFIFGDSLVDAGNNNNLQYGAKANYRPYGIDFPDGTTGRWTNGRTSADIIGEHMGFGNYYIKSFITVNDSDIVKGVNYASGSAGIQDDTGKFGMVQSNIELRKQIQNHLVTVSRIAGVLGNNASATQLLNQCLYLFVVGSNDFLLNSKSLVTPPGQYASTLIKIYTEQVQILYKAGARKIAMTAVPPVGLAVSAFNSRLQQLAGQLSQQLPDGKFLYVDSFGYTPPSNRPLAHPSREGLGAGLSCCVTGTTGTCVPNVPPCENRQMYYLWDSIHPTEAANRITGQKAYQLIQKIL